MLNNDELYMLKLNKIMLCYVMFNTHEFNGAVYLIVNNAITFV